MNVISSRDGSNDVAPKRLQNTLDEFYQWSKGNALTININRTKTRAFSTTKALKSRQNRTINKKVLQLVPIITWYYSGCYSNLQ